MGVRIATSTLEKCRPVFQANPHEMELVKLGFTELHRNEITDLKQVGVLCPLLVESGDWLVWLLHPESMDSLPRGSTPNCTVL